MGNFYTKLSLVFRVDHSRQHDAATKYRQIKPVKPSFGWSMASTSLIFSTKNTIRDSVKMTKTFQNPSSPNHHRLPTGIKEKMSKSLKMLTSQSISPPGFPSLLWIKEHPLITSVLKLRYSGSRCERGLANEAALISSTCREAFYLHSGASSSLNG